MSLFSPYYIIMSLIYHCIILLKWNSDSLSTRRQHSATENCPHGIRVVTVNKIQKANIFAMMYIPCEIALKWMTQDSSSQH